MKPTLTLELNLATARWLVNAWEKLPHMQEERAQLIRQLSAREQTDEYADDCRAMGIFVP